MSRPKRPVLRDTRSEKQVEHSGDRAMALLGFSVWRFSQARATMQSPGIPDRRYVHIGRKLAIWWEAKSAKGVQSPYQRAFQQECRATREHYVCGTDDVLAAYVLQLFNADR